MLCARHSVLAHLVYFLESVVRYTLSKAHSRGRPCVAAATVVVLSGRVGALLWPDSEYSLRFFWTVVHERARFIYKWAFDVKWSC